MGTVDATLRHALEGQPAAAGAHREEVVHFCAAGACSSEDAECHTQRDKRLCDNAQTKAHRELLWVAVPRGGAVGEGDEECCIVCYERYQGVKRNCARHSAGLLEQRALGYGDEPKEADGFCVDVRGRLGRRCMRVGVASGRFCSQAETLERHSLGRWVPMHRIVALFGPNLQRKVGIGTACTELASKATSTGHARVHWSKRGPRACYE